MVAYTKPQQIKQHSPMALLLHKTSDDENPNFISRHVGPTFITLKTVSINSDDPMTNAMLPIVVRNSYRINVCSDMDISVV